MKKNTVYDCAVVTLERHPSERLGNLSVIQSGDTLPFDVKRVFYIYDVPGGESRGGHAHRAIKEFIVAVSGSFSVTLDDFSSGAIALVFTSDHFTHADHIKDYGEFLAMTEKARE